MQACRFIKLCLGSLLLVGASKVAVAAGCDQTLSPGTNVASAIAAAPAGTTVCLNAGSYGSITLNNVVKTSEITIQSTTGISASLSLSISGSNRLKFENLTITALNLQGSTTKNITVAGSKFTGQAVLRMDGNSNANILIDDNSFDNISVCGNCYEGRLQVQGGSHPVGVKITNNHFGGPGESDGIQLGAPGVVIGPGNVFDGIVQGNYGRHVDAIQGYGQSRTTITGNYFINNDIQIMMPDGGNSEIITNNVFIASRAGNNGVQLGTHVNGTFVHNTVKNITVNMDKKVESSTQSQNAVARDNLMINSVFKTVDSNGNQACSNCTIDRNMFTTSGSARGTNVLVGTPVFIGGASPSTWAGYKLAATSMGYKAASDANDIGSNYFGAPTTLLPAPTNLRVQ
jgi:hypothetical protein